MKITIEPVPAQLQCDYEYVKMNVGVYRCANEMYDDVRLFTIGNPSELKPGLVTLFTNGKIVKLATDENWRKKLFLIVNDKITVELP